MPKLQSAFCKGREILKMKVNEGAPIHQDRTINTAQENEEATLNSAPAIVYSNISALIRRTRAVAVAVAQQLQQLQQRLQRQHHHHHHQQHQHQ